MNSNFTISYTPNHTYTITFLSTPPEVWEISLKANSSHPPTPPREVLLALLNATSPLPQPQPQPIFTRPPTTFTPSLLDGLTEQEIVMLTQKPETPPPQLIDQRSVTKPTPSATTSAMQPTTKFKPIKHTTEVTQEELELLEKMRKKNRKT